jgi:predicted nucleic acid-binding protein
VILADTSVWVNFFRYGDEAFAALLEAGDVSTHPFIIGELALGFLDDRRNILNELEQLPRVLVAQPSEILVFIEQHKLMGCGVGYVDIHLLASNSLSAPSQLLTRDKKLAAVAANLSTAR